MTDARAAYDAWHDRHDVDREADTPWHDLVRSHLAVAHRDVARALEIGCGRGGFACWLAQSPSAPRTLVAEDFSPAAVRKARAHGAERRVTTIRWAVGDITRLAHADGTFGLVITCETVEHVPDPPRALREIARVLRPGGRLILTTPNYLGAMGLYRGYRRLVGRPYTEEGQPINHLTSLPRTWSWIRRANLRILHTDGVGHYLPFPGRPPIRLRGLDRFRWMTRLTALHSLVVAEKPRS